MPERGNQHQRFRLAPHLHQASTFPAVEGQGKVRAAIADQSCGLCLREFAHIDRNRRPVMLQLEQQACKWLARQILSERKPNAFRTTVVLRAQRDRHSLHLTQNAPGVREESRPRSRQPSSPRRAMEQLGSKLRFKIADRMTEWRLLHPKAFSCAGEMKLCGYRTQMAKVPQFHAAAAYRFKMA